MTAWRGEPARGTLALHAWCERWCLTWSASVPRAADISIVLLALTLRVLWFDLMEFKFDEVDVLQLTQTWVQRGEVPQFGMMSGVGIRNPPGFIFLLWPWVAAHASPLAIGGCIAALNVLAVWLMLRLGRALDNAAAGRWAAAFMAVQPWLILYSRKIWAQSVLPLVVLLVLLLMATVHQRPRSRWVFWMLPLLALAWQIHFSAWNLVLVAFAWLMLTASRHRLNLPWAGAGALSALLLLAPYARHLAVSNFADLRAQAAVGGSIGLDHVAAVAWTWTQTAFAGGFGQVAATAPTSLARVLPAPLGPLLETLAWIGTVLALALAGVGVWTWRAPIHLAPLGAEHTARRDGSPHREELAAEVGRAVPASRLDSTPDLRLWLTAMALLPLVLYAVRGITAPPHYFIIGLPALLLLAGYGAARRRGRVGARLPGAIVVLCGAAVWLGVLQYLRLAGGTGGDYGIAYRHQAAAATILARAGIAAGQIDATLMRDDGVAVLFLHNRLLPESTGRANGKAKLLDTLRYPQLARAPFPAGWREERAGPLRIGLAPAPESDAAHAPP